MAKRDDSSQQAAGLRAALRSFLKRTAPSEWLRTRDFFHRWLFGHAWHQLVTDTCTDVCQFVALVRRLEQNRRFIIQDPFPKSLCRRRTYSEDTSGVVSLTKAFYSSAAGKLSWLRCKTEVVFIYVDHSQELFLPLVSPQGRLILS